MSNDMKCQLSNVTKCQMTRNVKCHEMSNAGWMGLVFISDRHSTAPHSTARLFLYLSSSREALSVLLLWLFDWIKSGQWVWGSVLVITIIGILLGILSWTAGLKMKNLSRKPVTGKTWRRKTFNLAVVAIHFNCSAISGWVLFHGTTLSSFRLLLVLRSVAPGVGSHFEAWVPPCLGMAASI